jgi:hypothetical protein
LYASLAVDIGMSSSGRLSLTRIRHLLRSESRRLLELNSTLLHCFAEALRPWTHMYSWSLRILRSISTLPSLIVQLLFFFKDDLNHKIKMIIQTAKRSQRSMWLFVRNSVAA